MPWTDDFDEIVALLDELGDVHLHVIQYRQTHSAMHLLLADDRFRPLADLYLECCLFIAGPLQGGRWSLRLTAKWTDDVREELKLESTCGAFMVRCRVASIETPAGLPPRAIREMA